MAITRLRLDQLPRWESGHFDFFICCASYEDRSVSISNAIDSATVRHALVALHKDTSDADSIAHNLHSIKETFSSKFRVIELFASDPVRSATNIVSALDGLHATNSENYLVDITTFTHETLLILFRVLYERAKPKYGVTLAYATAREYCPDVARENKWLSYGVSDVRSVLGYPGEVLPGRQNHLIVLVGYEASRASELVRTYEPDIVSLGYGAPGSGTESANEGSSQFFAKLLRETIATYCSVNEFTFASNDPINTRDSVLDQVKSTPSCNHIVAPMNTKISTVGAALAAIQNQSIQLCYARALKYNTSNYSSPGENCYLMDLSALLKTI